MLKRLIVLEPGHVNKSEVRWRTLVFTGTTVSFLFTQLGISSQWLESIPSPSRRYPESESQVVQISDSSRTRVVATRVNKSVDISPASWPLCRL